MGKSKQTKQTTGRIVTPTPKNGILPSHITVVYFVDRSVRFVREPVRYHEPKKTGLISMTDTSQRTPLLYALNYGCPVTVVYDPGAPDDAYIKENRKPVTQR